VDDPVTALVQLLTKASLDHGLLGLMIGSHLSWQAREELASLLLTSGCWEFQRPSSTQAPSGQDISPGGRIFGTVGKGSDGVARLPHVGRNYVSLSAFE
jgi:hypothetical protein